MVKFRKNFLWLMMILAICILFTGVETQNCKDQNCISCSSTACFGCKSNYSLSTNGGCWKCGSNCLECLHSFLYCTKCNIGYTLNSNL